MRPTIVYVHPHLTMWTGATHFVLETATGLQARGYPVVVVTGQADPEIVGGRKLEIVELGGPLPSNPRHWLGLAGLERRLFAALDGFLLAFHHDDFLAGLEPLLDSLVWVGDHGRSHRR